MAARVKGASSRVRVAALLLIVGLLAGPVGTHLYWMLGGTWGLGGNDSSTGIRVVGAFVALLIVAAVLVVLARAGLWQQTLVSDRVIRILAWALAGFLLVHGLLSFAEAGAGIADEWWLYGPGGLVIGVLALIVASSGGSLAELAPAAPDAAVALKGRGGTTIPPALMEEVETVGLVDLGDESYVSVTTFKRDGTPASTPVWVAREDGRLLIHSAANSWKVRRIRRNKHVRVAGCSWNGKVHGDTVDGEATLLADTATVQALEARKYGLVYRLFTGLTAFNRWLRRKPDVESVTIAIVPAPR